MRVEISKALRILAGLLFVLAALPACAGGPRFVTGTNSSNPGQPRGWSSTQPLLYFTDPGDLNKAVPHAQADSVVAAAAAVWNVPTSSLTVQQGGSLNQHVSSANTYFDGVEVVFPSDTSLSNAVAKPIAVIYDSDGSVTDLLLGPGASDPSSCRQHEVTDTVDGFDSSIYITHAVLVINGRCVGSTSDSLNQLKYLLMRSFGRVLGLGWSQTNDNVFTGASTVTVDQMANWPVMHPLDVICGSYTYLCMTNPFSLRPDDLNALAGLYPVTSANYTSGKVLTASGALEVYGLAQFSNGDGMGMVNLGVRVMPYNHPPEPWQTASGLTGYVWAQNTGNPVTGPEAPNLDQGTQTNTYMPGFYDVPRIVPLVPVDGYRVVLDVDPINPLYSGEYALGPFQRPPVTMSGSTTEQVTTQMTGSVQLDFKEWDSSAGCADGFYGTESSPEALPATGLFAGQICGISHPAWVQLTIRGGRTWTLEVQAVDETGGQTAAKLQPVMGVWNVSDPLGTLPTVASQPVPMNSATPGLSQLKLTAANTDNTYRLTVADAWGGGRPDFKYKARVLYADSVSPSMLTSSGGQITIAGTGFTPGNRVTVNGLAVQVLSWTTTQIVAVAPSIITARAQAGVPVDVVVTDLQTGGSTSIAGALTYPGGGTRQLALVNAPSTVEAGSTATVPFAVKVLASDGVTPVSGASVRLSVASGGGQLGACSTSGSCTLVSDSLGVVQSLLTGVSAGPVTISATELSGGVSLQITMNVVNPTRSVVVTTPAIYVAAGASISVPVSLQAVQDGLAAAAIPITWSSASGVGVSASSTLTASSGAALVNIATNAPAAGTTTVQGCAWNAVCGTWNMIAVDASQWAAGVLSGAAQSVQASVTLAPVVLRVADAAGHALAGAPVTVAQTVDAWQGTCPAAGRCPAAQVLASQSVSAVTDLNGLVSIAPLQVSGVPQVVNVAVSTGTTGFLALTLVKTP